MVPQKVEEASSIWATERQIVRKFHHEWHAGDVPVVSCVAVDEVGKSYVLHMDRNGLEIVITG